jgi:acetoin utilization deacetylase AcuC-like enzyme
MNILFTRTHTDKHYLFHNFHHENPERVRKAIVFFEKNTTYKSLIDYPNPKENDDVFELIVKAQGSNILNVFNPPPHTDLTCKNCKKEFINLAKCPKCKSTNFQWLIGYDTYISNNDTINAVAECISTLMSSLDNIIDKQKQYQYCLIRPPGHHCFNKGSGFCLINNVFVLSQYALDKGFKKVLILDYDYHHANGTSDLIKQIAPKKNITITEALANILITDQEEKSDPNNNLDRYLISMHAFSINPDLQIYPGTGSHLTNTANIKNVPLIHNKQEDRFRYNDKLCIKLFDERIIPWINEYGPDIILISNGLDAHKDDPVGKLNLTEKFYVHVANSLKKFNVPLIYVLEGGYNPDVVRDVSIAIVDELNN